MENVPIVLLRRQSRKTWSDIMNRWELFSYHTGSEGVGERWSEEESVKEGERVSV